MSARRVTATVEYPDGHKCDFHIPEGRLAKLRASAEAKGATVTVKPFTTAALTALLSSMGQVSA